MIVRLNQLIIVKLKKKKKINTNFPSPPLPLKNFPYLGSTYPNALVVHWLSTFNHSLGAIDIIGKAFLGGSRIRLGAIMTHANVFVFDFLLSLFQRFRLYGEGRRYKPFDYLN